MTFDECAAPLLWLCLRSLTGVEFGENEAGEAVGEMSLFEQYQGYSLVDEVVAVGMGDRMDVQCTWTFDNKTI